MLIVGFHEIRGATAVEGHCTEIKLVDRFYSQFFLLPPLWVILLFHILISPSAKGR